MERFVFPCREKAEIAREQMNQLIDLYGTASRADMLIICGKTPEPEDNKFGWVNLDNAVFEIDHVNFEYTLCLPKAMPFE